MSETTIPQGFEPGARMGGYRISRVAPLEEIRGYCLLLEHGETGTRHLHVACADGENTFAVGFKTVPSDDTGVAHILEHTALCGSENYPVRDPFFSMIKRSLNTFMNAFTASDWTMYPFASQNEKDFYNLMDVYLDAAFFPRLDLLSFRQEGHRLEFDEEGVLQRMGVVYNEMKGAMSSPSQIMGRGLLKALYPDVTYGFNSGGDPEHIPDLTHEDLLNFHKRHYHPSNAWFFTYGNFPLEKHLARIEEKVLSRFVKMDPKTEVPNQPRWKEGRSIRETYPATAGDDLAKSSQVAIGWLVSDLLDTRTVLGFSLLEHILLGNAGAPLRKALMDSGLGTALCDGCGFDGDNRDTSFVCGLKGMAEEDADLLEKLIFDTLTRLSDEGIERELIEAALHQLEFDRREISNTPYPYGLKLMLEISGTWFHGGDPMKVLHFDEDLAAINALLDQGYFEGLIREYLLQNPHRVRFVLAPDTEKQRRMDEKERKILDEIAKNLGEEEKKKILAQAKALEDLQESEEDLSSLPTLERGDIDPAIRESQLAETEKGIAVYDAATSGIVYAQALFGLGDLSRDDLALIPLFCHVLPRMGTKDMDYVAFAREMSLRTGGVGCGSHARVRMDEGNLFPFIGISGKALERNFEPMLNLMKGLGLRYDFSNTERLQQLLFEYRAAMEAGVVQNGHRLAMSVAARGLSPGAALSEDWAGLSQLKRVKAITDSIREGGKAVLEKLQADFTRMASLLFTRENVRFSLVCEKDIREAAISGLCEFGENLGKEGGFGFHAPAGFFHDFSPIREAWTTATAVSFVATAFATPRMEHPDAPVYAIMAKLLKSSYLHREIREKGGAYGGFALFNGEDGVFSMASYRDPHIRRTLDTFVGAVNFLASGDFTETDVEEALLQVCSDMDRPDTPVAFAKKSFMREMIGLSDELRRNYRKRLLAVDRKAVCELAARVFTKKNIETANIAVVTGVDILEQEDIGEALKVNAI
ncbi:insulinase family protein [Desulfococcaceae bacterium OttesenSCG-928-F15]|nr:insulinase family protein [Desulfococcaceae bacterium OttesenSCG-928-F15]